jgi:hypothetical protein
MKIKNVFVHKMKYLNVKPDCCYTEKCHHIKSDFISVFKTVSFWRLITHTYIFHRILPPFTAIKHKGYDMC